MVVRGEYVKSKQPQGTAQSCYLLTRDYSLPEGNKLIIS